MADNFDLDRFIRRHPPAMRTLAILADLDYDENLRVGKIEPTGDGVRDALARIYLAEQQVLQGKPRTEDMIRIAVVVDELGTIMTYAPHSDPAGALRDAGILAAALDGQIAVVYLPVGM